MEELKALPSSIETEQVLLGCLINETSSFIEADEIIDEEDFYLNKHKQIYRTIKEIINKGSSADLVTISESLKKDNLLSECGGITYLSQLSSAAIGYSFLKNYIKIIKEKSARRKLILAGQKLIQSGFEADIDTTIEETENKLFDILSSKSNDIVSVQEAVEMSFSTLEERYKVKGKLRGLSTGFHEIDKLSSGLRKTDFIVIAARPSMGKTAFALNIGQAASKFGSVAIFSIEMAREQLMDRFLSARCLIDFNKITDGDLSDNQWGKILNEAALLKKRKLFIDDKARMLNDIKAKCRKLKMQQGLDVVIIDYLQLIRTNKKTSSREQEVSYISQELKALAKELDITVIALAQLSRAPEQRLDHRPILSDLRESGSIEQDADIIHFLYRDEYYNKETEDRNIAEVITAKNRNGITKTTKLAWIGQYQRFGTLDVIHR
ncbi:MULTISPECIES: replicative DNA helicase [Clostridium]|uniref:Replicative DNA helicase n=1 Tax=Clostridium cadaveris TaxID=1529 RepID=A0A316ME91_9CLOT|nr:replicative DNA helicase [Clostridium cadaveris]MDU4952959.1 replicative DNA helicase [Clostridium sp.]PWL55435.1 MAG: replicative DNA helicase [Clostridium cadaveris]